MKTFKMKSICNDHINLFQMLNHMGFAVKYSYDTADEYPNIIHVQVFIWVIEISW